MFIPIIHVLELGGDEFLGLRDERGDFHEITSLKEVPSSYWQEVERFGSSLGLVQPCTAFIVINEEQVGSVKIDVVEGRPGCVSIHCTNRALTGALLRQIPIGRLVREAAMASTVRVLSTDMGIAGARYVDGGPGFGQLHEDLRAELEAVEDDSRRRVINYTFLTEVAQTYREALALGRPPAKAVQDAFGPTTPENARRWIMTARRNGFLGPARGRGKAGEL